VAEPMYQQIAQALLKQIESGTIPPGTPLPTQLKLCEQYGASRNTIRDAVKWLAVRGLVETKPGRGTFIAQRFRPFVTTLSADPGTGLGGGEGDGAYAEIMERGLSPSASVPRVEVLTAPVYIAERLRITEGTQVITRRQQRYIDMMPWSRQITAYPMELVQQGALELLVAQDIPGGTIAYLRRTLGLAEIGHRDNILVRGPDDNEARFFELPDDGRVPVVCVIRTGYRDSAEGPVPYRVTFTSFPADRNQFVFNTGQVPRELAEPASDQQFDGITNAAGPGGRRLAAGNCCSARRSDGAAAQHGVAPIEHRGLARGHRAGRLVKHDPDVLAIPGNGALVHLAVGPQLDLAIDGLARGRASGPDGTLCGDLAYLEAAGRADGHGSAHRLDAEHVPRTAVGSGAVHAQPLALPDGEPVGAVVRAEHRPVLIHDLARYRPQLPGQEAAGIAVRDEADVVAVGLVRDEQATVPGLLAHIGLLRVA
jgi:GntR family transcriptional regulator